MARPVYERPGDRERQRRVAERIAGVKGYAFTEARELDEVDYVFSRRDGTVAFVAEIKTRTNSYESYPTYNVSEHKMRALEARGRRLGCPAYLFVRFTDGDAVYGPVRAPYGELVVWGRRDRKDPLDVEVAVAIPMDRMRRW